MSLYNMPTLCQLYANLLSNLLSLYRVWALLIGIWDFKGESIRPRKRLNTLVGMIVGLIR